MPGDRSSKEEQQPTSITHFEQSPDSRVSANLQIAIGHIEAAAWAMKSMTTYDDPPDGITDADWLQQIASFSESWIRVHAALDARSAAAAS